MSIKINPDIFFLIRPEGILLWDYKNHKQFLIEKEYFVKICEVNLTKQLCLDDPVVEELVCNGVISHDNEKVDVWPFDILC